MSKYNLFEEQLRMQLMETILEYLEGNETQKSVIGLGLAADSRKISKDSSLFEVVSRLNTIGHETADGKNFSEESIKQTFTTMLEKLISG